MEQEDIIKIYLDKRRKQDVEYIEDSYSSSEIMQMEEEEFAEYIKKHQNIHSCYAPFICHIGRFVREHGDMWAGIKIIVFRSRIHIAESENEYIEVEFDDEGQLKAWPYGFFG